MAPKNHNYLMHDIEYISATPRLLIRGMGCHRLQNNFISILEVQIYVLNIISEKMEKEHYRKKNTLFYCLVDTVEELY